MAYELLKSSSGIEGFDSILRGGYPRGRTTLIHGSTGSGKTILSLQFLIYGAMNGEPGVFISFEERADSVRENALSLGWDLKQLEKEGKLVVVDAKPDPSAVHSGHFNFSGLFAILDGLVEKLKAKRIVIDAIDLLLQLLQDPAQERNHIYQLHDWILNKNITALLTSKITGDMPDYPFVEFLTDCVIRLRPVNENRQRLIQIVKYRGSDYNDGLHPYIINQDGIYIYPMTHLEINHTLIGNHISTGLPGLDSMMGGGYRKGSCIAIAGTSGTGKTTFASKFAVSACERGEQVLYINFEESVNNMIILMKSSGTDLATSIKKGHLKIISQMPEAAGPEDHLYFNIREMESHKAQHLILDAISACQRMGSVEAAYSFLHRILDYCRKKNITVLLTYQANNPHKLDEVFGIGISSMIDSIIYLNYVQIGGEVNRTVMVMKSRGSEHSNQYREFLITSGGLKFIDIYSGKGGMLTGTARLEQESREKLETQQREELIHVKIKEIDRMQKKLEAEILSARANIDKAEAELLMLESENRSSLESEKQREKWRKRTSADHTKKINKKT
jgi:circadian clock protein KaiC